MRITKDANDNKDPKDFLYVLRVLAALWVLGL
jgi:hypothetical protein